MSVPIAAGHRLLVEVLVMLELFNVAFCFQRGYSAGEVAGVSKRAVQ
jgi:hypothetical protein